MKLHKVEFSCNQYTSDELFVDDIIGLLNSEEIVSVIFEGRNDFVKVITRLGIGFIKSHNLELHESI